MTFGNFESSRDKALPVTLYLVQYGNGPNDYFAYTDHREAIVYQGHTYEPVAIGRAAVKASGSLEQNQFTVDIAPNAPLAEFMADRIPDTDVRLTVRAGHLDDPDGQFLLVWKGRIVGTKRKDTTVELGCESLLSSLRRPALVRQYQRSCGWTHYEPHCNAPRRVRASVAPVVIGQNVVVVSGNWNGSLAPGKFKGGYVSWDGVRAGSVYSRTILDVTPHARGHSLLLQGDTFGVSASTILRLFAGCNRLQDDCKNIHNNILNFGGQPHIPTENPIGFPNRFY